MSRPAYAPPSLPREHGAWVMLALPVIFGVRLGGATRGAVWLAAVAALLVFLAYYAVTPPLRRRFSGRPVPRAKLAGGIAWGAAYLAGGLAAFAGAYAAAPTFAHAELRSVATWAALLGAIHGGASIRGAGRQVLPELVGMAGFALVAPIIALSGGIMRTALLLPAAMLAFVYSASALAYVRAYRAGADETRAATVCVLTHAALFAGMSLTVNAVNASPWLLTALVPPALRTTSGLASRPETLQRLGMIELNVAVAVAILGAIFLV